MAAHGPWYNSGLVSQWSSGLSPFQDPMSEPQNPLIGPLWWLDCPGWTLLFVALESSNSIGHHLRPRTGPNNSPKETCWRVMVHNRGRGSPRKLPFRNDHFTTARTHDLCRTLPQWLGRSWELAVGRTIPWLTYVEGQPTSTWWTRAAGIDI